MEITFDSNRLPGTYDWLVVATPGTTRGATEETEGEEGDVKCCEEIQKG